MNDLTRLLLRLQRTLWVRTMRDNPAAGVVMVLLVLYAIGGLGLLTNLLIPAAHQGQWSALAGMVGLGALAYVGVAVVLPSGESQLRPAMFAVLPVTARQILPSLAWSTLLTSRGVLAIGCTLVTTVIGVILLLRAGHVPAAVLLPVAMLLALVTTLLLGELVGMLGTGGGRVSQERSNVIGAVLVIVFIFAFSAFSGLGAEYLRLDLIGDVLAWTPLGAGVGALTSAVQGRWLITLGQAVVAATTLAVGVWWWARAVRARLVAPLDAAGSATRERDRRRGEEDIPLLLPGLPYTPAAVVYSRAVRYLRRDSRMLASLVMFPVFAAFLLVQGVFINEFNLYLAMLLVALMVGSLAANDFGYDGPGTWVHLVAGAPARTLLLARHAASVTPMLILLVVVDAVGILLAGSRDIAVLVAVVSGGLVVSSAAIALFFTTFNPFPTSRPGTNPWSDKSGFSGAAFLSAFASLFLGWIPVAPGAALLIIGYLAGSGWLLAVGVVVVLVLPVVLHVVAAAVCTRRVEQRLPEIHHKVRAWVD